MCSLETNTIQASVEADNLGLVLTSRVPRPRTLPSEKWSGERSKILWAYSPKVVMTNEIVKIGNYYAHNSKICSSPFEHPYLF